MKLEVKCNRGAMQVQWRWDEQGTNNGGWSAQPRDKVGTTSRYPRDIINFMEKFRR